LRVQSGRLRVSDACVLIGLQRRQVFRLLRGLKQDGALTWPHRPAVPNRLRDCRKAPAKFHLARQGTLSPACPGAGRDHLYPVPN